MRMKQCSEKIFWSVVVAFSCSLLVSVFCQQPEVNERSTNFDKSVFSFLNVSRPFEYLFRPYLDFIDDVYRRLQGNYSNVSEKCQLQTKEIMRLAGEGNVGALTFLDATGKPSSGILTGSASLLGFYSQCLNAKIKNLSNELSAVGSYCLIRLNSASQTYRDIFPKASFDVFTQTNNKPSIGICVPSTCSTEDVQDAVNETLNLFLNETMGTPECYADNDSFFDVPSAIILAFFMTFAALVIFSTVFDGWTIKHELSAGVKSSSNRTSSDVNLSATSGAETVSYQESGSTIQLHNTKNPEKKGGVLKPFILAFSLRANAAKVFSVERTSESIDSLHGLRFYSMLLIIFGHTYAFATQDMSFRNTDAMNKAPKSFMAQIFSNGTLAVDSFYFISGLLIALLTLKVMKRTGGKIPYLYFYVHRYVRLTPLFLVVIAFCATLLQYISSGPNWNLSIMMYSPWCKKNWYLNALYVHNFFRTPNMCLSHSWYLATDMQFYIVTPLIIVPLYKNRLWGAIIIGAFLIATTVTTGVLTAINKYPAIPYINNAEPLELMNEYYNQIYIKPYCRMGPYLVGIIAGYVLWQYKTVTLKKLYVVIGWGLTMCAMLFILFIMHGANEGNLPPVSAAAAYSALARTVWALGLGWLTLMCHYGYGAYK